MVITESLTHRDYAVLGGEDKNGRDVRAYCLRYPATSIYEGEERTMA